MGDKEEEELKMAMRMSMQNESPEPKRSKPGENDIRKEEEEEESPEVRNRRMQRELMAAAAEKRMMLASSGKATGKEESKDKSVKLGKSENLVNFEEEGKKKDADLGKEYTENQEDVNKKNVDLENVLGEGEAKELFSIVFGSGVSRDILAQWSNQGIRFSPDQETSMGLVQHEGGPCGVLAAIQAFVLKHLLFFQEKSANATCNRSAMMGSGRSSTSDFNASISSLLEEDKTSRALIRSMAEILFQCGSNQRAVIASLSIPNGDILGSEGRPNDEVIGKALEGLSIESGANLHKVLRVSTFTSQTSAVSRLEMMLPLFRSRMGALLFLISALLSRGLESVQADRDDPSQPLVTAPFGHASQEIVNLLLCGKAVANVFDGDMDLGGGMFVKGISSPVEVGFLTLLESLNFCKVGQRLKHPKWPIWVVGSESHYTVLFALDTKVQEENELESRETQIRRAFDAQDQSGGGGFISVEGFHQVLRDASISLPADKLDHLCSSGFIVWSEFWQVILDLDKSLGGLKDSTGSLGQKVFDVYHFNGIAKSVVPGSQSTYTGKNPIQRPRLTKLRVSVPPRWTPEEYMAGVSGPSTSGKNDAGGNDAAGEVSKPEPPQHAPLVDCIRTRWARAVCNWEGDAPSIV